MDTIICPHCHKSFPATEVFSHELDEQKKKLSEESEKMRKETEMQLRKKLEQEINEKSNLELLDIRKQLEEKNQKISEFREQELKLREAKRELEEEKKENDIKVQRTVDEQRKKIEEETLKRAEEAHYLKEKEKDHVIDNLKRALDEASRKASVGSQQVQGEVGEVELEEHLRSEFPNDQIESVEKGVKGADVRQIVKSPRGVVCGVILWESKRAKAWSDSWINKLKSDLRAESAHIPVLITNIFPKDISNNLGQKDGVIVVGFTQYLTLAYLLRKNLLEVGFEKAKATHRGEKADFLYEYITSHEFLQQIEVMLEVQKEIRSQIRKERDAFERIWKARESQAERLTVSTSSIVGSIQGKIGQAALQVKDLELLEDGGIEN